MTRLLLALFAIAPLALGGPGEPRTKARTPSPAEQGVADGEAHRRLPGLGDGFFKQGNYRQAAEAFRKEIAANPESVPAHLGLGRAFTRLGRCDVALREFWPYVGMKAFGAEVALAAAVCSGRLGFADDAVMFSQMAVDRDPTNTSALTNLVLALDANGQFDDLEALLDQLAVARDDRDSSFYAKAVLALRRGDLTEFDIVVREWPTDRNTVRNLWGLEGQSWLDLDDPLEVSRVMRGIKRIRRPGLARMVNAEAVRREGETWQALDILEGRALKSNETTDSDAIRVRVLADQGDFDGAEELLSSYVVENDADLTASAWYVAWHRRDRAAMRKWRDAYLVVRVSPLRNLYKLIPINWRLDHRPGDPMPLPPDPSGLRAAAAAAREKAEEQDRKARPGVNSPRGPGALPKPGR